MSTKTPATHAAPAAAAVPTPGAIVFNVFLSPDDRAELKRLADAATSLATDIRYQTNEIRSSKGEPKLP